MIEIYATNKRCTRCTCAKCISLCCGGTAIILHFIFHRHISDNVLVPGNNVYICFTFHILRFTSRILPEGMGAASYYCSVSTKSRRAEHRLPSRFVRGELLSGMELVVFTVQEYLSTYHLANNQQPRVLFRTTLSFRGQNDMEL